MRRLISPLLVAISLTVASAAWAGPPTDLVRAKQTELWRLLEKDGDATTKKRIGAIFDEMLDYAALAEASLGPEWKNLKDSERVEFTGLLKELVQRAYEKNLKKTLAYEILYVSEEPAGDDAFLVKTRAKSKTDAREEPIEIDFKLVDKGSGKFLMADIVTEGVSLVSSYRSQFLKIIKKDGFAALTAKMREKIAKGA